MTDPNKWRFTVDAKIAGTLIEFEYRTTLGDIELNLSRAACETSDKATRAALIKLGWTPPKDTLDSPEGSFFP